MVLIESESSLSSLQMGYFHRADFFQAGVYHKGKCSFLPAHLPPPHSKEKPLGSSRRDAVGREPQASAHLPECVTSSAGCAVWPPFLQAFIVRTNLAFTPPVPPTRRVPPPPLHQLGETEAPEREDTQAVEFLPQLKELEGG